MRGVVLAALALLGVASAGQPIALPDVLDLVSVAQHRVWLYAPRLTEPELAEAVQEAALNAPLPLDVRVVTVPFFSVAPDSLVTGLAFAGVPVFEANVSSREGVLLVDDRVFTARDLGKRGVATLEALEAASTTATRRWFEDTTTRAPRLTKSEAYRRLRALGARRSEP